MKVKRVAVIGAGSAGLAGARRLLEDPARFSCTVFEQTGAIGGTWVYNEHVGKDEFGLPLHTSMYKNLRVNVPKDIMGYPGYQVPELDGRSYISAEEFLQFLNDFADHFRIRERVRFYHRVQRVVPTESGGWKVFTTDLLAKEDKEEEFDAVMVCNGHFFEPSVPAIPGADAFQGQSLHSHDFRVPEPFKDLNVVVVGGRASAMDVCLMVARAGAASVLLSHNWQDPMPVGFPANARQAPGVARLGTRSVHFEDGSEAQCDVIIYCTGYLYSFPFLGDLVRVVDNHVQLLYKHVVHIDYPTLAFIGLPSLVCTNPLFDLQVRFFLSTVAGTALLPSREEMLAELERDIELRKEKGLKPRHAHSMGSFQDDYYKSLAESGKVEPLPPVYAKLHYHSMMRFRDDFVNFRENYYEIVDDENFIFIENK